MAWAVPTHPRRRVAPQAEADMRKQEYNFNKTYDDADAALDKLQTLPVRAYIRKKEALVLILFAH
jgi:hypothetical protein